MPAAIHEETFVTVFHWIHGVPDDDAWMPVSVPLIALPRTVALELSSAMPIWARSIVFQEKVGELPIATRGFWSFVRVDQRTEPEAGALNWTPCAGMLSIVLFRVKRISFPGAPSAISVPSTNNARCGLNRTVVPGRIVRVIPGATVTFCVTTYVVSARPHVVSLRITPGTARTVARL